MGENKVAINFVIDDELAARLDSFCRSMPFGGITRSAAMRHFIVEGLDANDRLRSQERQRPDSER